jgi:hypothetical protein
MYEPVECNVPCFVTLPGCFTLSDEREPVADLLLPPLECGGV